LKKCNARAGKRFVFSKACCLSKMFFPWYPLGITNLWKRKEKLTVDLLHLVKPTDQGITKIGESPGSRLRVPYSIKPLSRALPSTKKGFQVSSSSVPGNPLALAFQKRREVIMALKRPMKIPKRRNGERAARNA
jgi:hypothetical protein